MTYTSSNPTSQRDFFYNLDGTLASITGSGSALVYTWNTNGQATSRTLNGVSTDLHWDVDGRLVSASQSAPDGGVSLDAQYVYDGLGMRRSASVNGVTRSWSWGGVDGEDEVGEDGKLTTSVGPYRVGEGTTAFTHDALGSVTGQNGMAIDYSVWGTQSAALTPASSVGFAGGRVESILGLNYNRRRWEDPASGIFLSRDEVGAKSYLTSPNGLGPWSYAAQNPARFVDPDGRLPSSDSLPPQTAVAMQCGYVGERCSSNLREGIYRSEIKANAYAAGGQSLVLCLIAPACREALIFGSKALFVGQTAIWATGLQGHDEQENVIETTQDPVTMAAGAVFGSAYRCGDRWEAGDCALTVANLLTLTRAAVMTPTARTLALSAYLEAAPMELEAPEMAALRTFKGPIAQQTATTSAPQLPWSSPSFSQWSPYASPQKTMTWEQAFELARTNPAKQETALIETRHQGLQKDLALGLSGNMEIGPGALKAFARPVNANTYVDIFGPGLPDNFGIFEENLNHAMQSAQQLRFSMNGIDKSEFQRFLRNPSLRPGDVTNWELYRVLTDPRLSSKTTFYDALGNKIEAPLSWLTR